MRLPEIAFMALILCAGCSAGKTGDSAAADPAAPEATPLVSFDADSAYSYVEQLVAFGPRVPNTEAHRLSGNWLASQLRDFGWEVTEQTAQLKAFDGTNLRARNIFAQINPDAPDRLLLLAHWDSRPWADNDPDPAKRTEPVVGANDGASGVGVLLEIARNLGKTNSAAAVDILLVDAEDWGNEGDDSSWALGTRYFVENPPVTGYRPKEAILLDMVGSPSAQFRYEYFSAQSNPTLLRRLWERAAALGYGTYFIPEYGTAVTDDHVELINAGIPAVDIIDYRVTDDYQGFDPVWHTTADKMDNISRETLRAVGETVAGEIGR